MITRRDRAALEQGPVVDDDSPWPGLLAFREANRRFFFGRGLELDDLFRRVRRETLTVLYAQSGLGKTSLLQAGLFPRLREEGFLPVPIRLDYGDDEPRLRADADPPGRQIAQAIAAAIQAQQLTGASDPLAARGPWEYLHDVEFDLPDETGSLLVPVLVFDQLEELFTLASSRRDNGRFAARTVELLGDLIENRPPRALDRAMREDPSLVDRFAFAHPGYRVLLSLREDYLPHLHALRGDIPSIVLNNVRLTRFDHRQALDVVERPGAARHLVTTEVAQAIVRTVAGQDAQSEEIGGARAEVDPSLLSLFCRQLNELRLRRDEVAISLELVMSSQESVLHDFYVDSFRDLAAPKEGGAKAFVEDFLLTQKGYRDRLSVERANEILVDRYHGTPDELNALVDRRLLHVEERGKTPQIELTHDVLAPIAMHERADRMHAEELRQAEERRLAGIRRAEQEEQQAKDAAAVAAAELRRARRQQRVTMMLLGFALLAAGAAAWMGFNARRANASLRISQRAALSARGAADSAASRALAAESTAVKEREAQTVLTEQAGEALVQANTEKTRSSAMLDDFCTYALNVVNRFGDSTNSNSGLQQAYNTLLELSDTSVDRMIERSPGEVCPRQLDARVASIRSNLLNELSERDASIMHGKHALAATLRLRPYADPVSRHVATLSLTDLTHAFYFDHDYADAATVAAEAIPLARSVNRSADSLAYDRLARLYHYGALARWHQGKVREADDWIRNGLAAADSGILAKHQNPSGLYFTLSQLWLDKIDVDTSLHHVDSALASMRGAVEAARRRYVLLPRLSQLKWLGDMYGWYAELARSVGRYDDAVSGSDSSIATWHTLVDVGRKRADTSWVSDGVNAISVQLIAKSRALLGAKHRAEGLATAHAAEDSLLALVRMQASVHNLHAMAGIEDSLANIYHDVGLLVKVDSAYLREYLLDSTIAYLPSSDSAAALDYYGALYHLSLDAGRWAKADTIGQDSAHAIAILFHAADRQRRYAEQQVVVSRLLRRWSMRQATTSADSQRMAARQAESLGADLGSLAWYELQSGRAQQAASHAEEATALAPKATWILVNRFNALVLSGRREEAKQFFAVNANRTVETPPVPFPCAVRRDMTELFARGQAEPEHREFVTELAAPYACDKTAGR
ncbi:MAG TPA: hypothetical protein VN677_10740 [Gemmatimonadaceae bacterium]|nr:hypothetical protein [Gemmatimonadaceae bacterium]